MPVMDGANISFIRPQQHKSRNCEQGLPRPVWPVIDRNWYKSGSGDQ